MAQQGTIRSVVPPVKLQAIPAIPDKLYFRIGEVAALCEVPTYVLRFWESEFPQLKPNKGGTGQRLYRRRDVETALRVKTLLYDEGFTIPGARQVLKTEQRQKEPQLSLAIVGAETAPASEKAALHQLRKEMRELLSLLAVSPRKTGPPTVRAIRPPRAPRPVEPGSDDLFG